VSKNLVAYLSYEIVKYITSRVVCVAAPAVMLGVIVTAYNKIMAKSAKVISVNIIISCISRWKHYLVIIW